MLTLYSQEQATDMMLASAKKESRRLGLVEGQRIGEARGETRGTIKGIILLLKTQGTSSQDAAAMLQKILPISKSEAEEAIRMYW